MQGADAAAAAAARVDVLGRSSGASRGRLGPIRALAIAFGVSIVPVLAVQLFGSRLYFVLDPQAYLVFHNVAEFFSVMVSLSIFGVGWFTHDQSRDRHALFLSCAFLAIGLMDFMHALSYAGMPALVTPSSPNKASTFWVAARLLSAAALLGSAFVLPDRASPWLSKRALVVPALGIPALVFVLVTFAPSRLPAAYVPGLGQTPFKQHAEFAIIGLFALAIGAYWRRFLRTGDRLIAYYLAAFLLCAFGELFFAVYRSVTDTYNALGHAYKIVAFYLVYRGIFIASVQRPYRGLVESGAALRREVAERQAAEQALGEETRKLHSILDSMAEAVVVADAKGNLVEQNRAAERLFGAGRGLVPGGPARRPDILRADGATPCPPEETPLARATRGEKLDDVELFVRRPDGGGSHVAVTGRPVLDAAGKIVGGVVVMADVTERRLMEGQLRQSQKLEAVGRLAGGVAHDFNNLLTAIIGAADLLLESIPASDPLHEEAADIREASRRAASLTRQLLTFSRKQIVQPTVLDLNEIVTGMDRMLRRLIGEDVELVAIPGAGLGHVRGDAGQIEQVIVNLAVNARDAMPAGGRLTIETANADLDGGGVGRPSGAGPSRYVMLAVSDTGCGMSAEVQSHLFEPFFTTKETGKGTGLGLSTVYGIVKQAGGYVRVRSESGKGSAFEICLPRVDEGLDAAAKPEGGGPSRGRETVLVVEDEPLVRRLAVKVLRNAGYTVLEAADGGEALRRVAEAGAGAIDLLVTDLVMPGTGGEDLADRVRRERPGIEVLFISGYTERAAGFQDRGEPGPELLPKPFAPDALARRVRELLDRRTKGSAIPG